jgi:peroxiredoxin
MSGSDASTNVVSAYKVTAYPTTYVIDSAGHVLGRWIGIDEPKKLAELRKVLKEACGGS